jgi:hypothetical protein
MPTPMVMLRHFFALLYCCWRDSSSSSSCGRSSEKIWSKGFICGFVIANVVKQSQNKTDCFDRSSLAMTGELLFKHIAYIHILALAFRNFKRCFALVAQHFCNKVRRKHFHSVVVFKHRSIECSARSGDLLFHFV